MRLRFELLLAAVVALGPLTAAAQRDPVSAAPLQIGDEPSRAQVVEALAEVAADPNLATERTVSTLRWKRREAAASGESWLGGLLESILQWLEGLFGWVAASGRLLVWVLGAIGAALLIYYVTRLVRARGVPKVPRQFAAPSHVRDLDIRPESLPDDVGAAALALWQRGEHRAALALLYRGLLSRLVHGYGVPIRASSTEGDCLRLANQRLPESSARYAAQLVAVWSAAVYGAREPALTAVQDLCREFAAALDRTGGG